MSDQSRYIATNEVTSTASDVKAEEARVKRSRFEFDFERNQQLSDKITFVESVDTTDKGGIVCNVTVDGIPCLALVDHQDRTDTGIGLTSIFYCPEECCSKFADDKSKTCWTYTTDLKGYHSLARYSQAEGCSYRPSITDC